MITLVGTQLVFVLAAASLFASIDSFGCTSPCQYASEETDSSDVVPCVITDCLGTLSTLTVSSHEAPSAPRNVEIKYFNETARDGHTYLSISPEWQAPLEGINLLTGFEIKTLCNKSPCVSQEKCVTVTFNRTLTTSDALNEFSLDCLFGNFSQPEMEYVTIIRSLPQNTDGTNRAMNSTTLPSCEEVPEVSLCKIDSDENWRPLWLPSLKDNVDGSLTVFIWPAPVRGRYPRYLVRLNGYDPSGSRPIYFQQKSIQARIREDPFVIFYNITTGRYRATVQIEDCADCPQFQSKIVNITTLPEEPSQTTASYKYTDKSRDAHSEKNTPSLGNSNNSGGSGTHQLSLAALAGVLGCCLGVILVAVLLYLTCTRKWRVVSRETSREREETSCGKYDQCDDDDDFDDGTKHIFGKFPHLAQDSNCNGLMGIDNPSMIPQTVYNDLGKPDGILQHESNHYANIYGHGKGDSISTVDVNVHSYQSGIWASPKLTTSSQPGSFVTSPVQGDSIVELDEDIQTLVLSLALNEHIGEEV